MKFISTNIETAREARRLYNEGFEKNNRPQQTPVEAVNKIYQELNNICFNAPLPDFDSSTIYIDRNF